MASQQSAVLHEDGRSDTGNGQQKGRVGGRHKVRSEATLYYFFQKIILCLHGKPVVPLFVRRKQCHWQSPNHAVLLRYSTDNCAIRHSACIRSLYLPLHGKLDT